MADNQATQSELFPQENTCNRCKRPREDQRYKLCVACREELNGNTSRKREEALADGFCVKCYRNPAMPGMRNCVTCNEAENKRSKAKADRAREAKRCVACGKEPETGKRKCAECAIKSVKCSNWHKRKLKLDGRCVNCMGENDLSPKVYCSSCTAKKKAQRDQLKIDAFNAYGGPICACCGETILEFLSIDHVNNDGADHRRRVAKHNTNRRRFSTGWEPPSNGQGVLIYRWLKKHNYPEGFQVLCMNCNFAKGRYGSCPHQRDNSQKTT